MRIDILVGENTYGTATHFSKSLAAAFERQNVKTRLYWIGDGQFFHAFYDILNDPPDFTCSFSDITLERRPLSDLWQIPHLFMMLDPPVYFLHQLTTKRGWVSCVDENDCAFVKSLKFSNTFFLPHGVDVNHKTAVEKSRRYDTVFFGSCIDYEVVESLWQKEEKDLLLTACEKVLSQDGLSIAQALIELGVKENDFPRYHSQVDRYTRGRDRIELIRSLGNHPVHIWGNGPWKKYFPHHPIHSRVNFEQTLEIMKESKLVLNSSPRFKAGAHERIFYALMCGAAVYSGATPYIHSILPEIETYTYGKWERPCLINCQERALAAQKKYSKPTPGMSAPTPF